jgi:hypothetical protein
MNSKNSSIVQENGYYIFECPHCEGIIMVAVNEVNCTIFRHCVSKSDFQQINPLLDSYETLKRMNPTLSSF